MSEVRTMVGDTTKEATDSAAAAEEISASLDPIKHTIFEAARVAEVIEEQVNAFKIEYFMDCETFSYFHTIIFCFKTSFFPIEIKFSEVILLLPTDTSMICKQRSIFEDARKV